MASNFGESHKVVNTKFLSKEGNVNTALIRFLSSEANFQVFGYKLVSSLPSLAPKHKHGSRLPAVGPVVLSEPVAFNISDNVKSKAFVGGLLAMVVGTARMLAGIFLRYFEQSFTMALHSSKG